MLPVGFDASYYTFQSSNHEETGINEEEAAREKAIDDASKMESTLNSFVEKVKKIFSKESFESSFSPDLYRNFYDFLESSKKNSLNKMGIFTAGIQKSSDQNEIKKCHKFIALRFDKFIREVICKIKHYKYMGLENEVISFKKFISDSDNPLISNYKEMFDTKGGDRIIGDEERENLKLFLIKTKESLEKFCIKLKLEMGEKVANGIYKMSKLISQKIDFEVSKIQELKYYEELRCLIGSINEFNEFVKIIRENFSKYFCFFKVKTILGYNTFEVLMEPEKLDHE